MITSIGLKKIYENKNIVLEDINFKVEKGDVYGLVGRSGAGKSTLLRCINGLTDYQDGSMKVNGHEVKDLNTKQIKEFRKNIGMIFQHFSLLERKSIYDNIALPMRCWKYSKKEIDSKVNELLELVELKDKAGVRPRNLSGGQKQRVAIARALTMNPSILLCDEATSALDPSTTNSILDLLSDINKKIGITIVLVTHEMSVIQRICNKVSILENGKIASQGTVKDIFLNQPPALKRLIGIENSELPEKGRNIRFMYRVEKIEGSELIARMVNELNIKFSIMESSTQSYRNDKISTFVINIDDSNFNLVTNYLDKNRVEWMEIKNDGNEVRN